MQEVEKKIIYKAIIVGLLVDTIGSEIAGVIFTFCYGLYLAIQKMPQAEIAIELQNGYPTLIFGLIVGFAFTVLGGYIAGKIAGKNQILHGGITGGLSLFVGFAILLIVKLPTWYNITFTLLAIPFGMLGGLTAKNRQYKKVA